MRLMYYSMLVLPFLGLVSAISGVSPGSYEVDFVNSINEGYSFNFIFDEGVRSEIYVSGPMSEYITLDKETIVGSETVVARLNVGIEALETPGLNKIKIGARQISGEGGGVGISSDVRGIIKVEVPYPGKYIDLEVVAPDANAGDRVELILRAFNRGNESVVLKPQIQIFKNDEKVGGIVFDIDQIFPYDTHEYVGTLDTSGYLPGDYIATGLGEYNKGAVARVDNPFRLGEFKVLIGEYTKSFDGASIFEFNIEVTSNWNGIIDGLYAEVNINGYPDSSFLTSTTFIGAWKTIKLVGFFDTNEIRKDSVSGEIILHYGGEISRQNIDLEIVRERDYFSYFIYLLIFIVLLGIIYRVVLFGRRYQELRR